MVSSIQRNIPDVNYIFENITTAFIFEQKGIVVKLNIAVEKLLGYNREEIIGLRSQQLRNIILKGGNDGFLTDSDQMFCVKRKDGQLFWATIEIDSFFNDDDTPVSVWKIEDVSKRRESEIKLKQMSLAVEQSSNSVVITNTEGIIQYVNSAFTTTTGYSAQEIIGKNSSILQSGLTPTEVFKEMWNSISRGKEWNGQFSNRKKNGDIYEEDVVVVPIRDELGNISNFIASKENITELKKARQQAEMMSKAKGDFLAYVGHEIRTPLNVIAGMSEFVLEAGLETEQQKFIKRIKSSAKSLVSIVNDLLDHSKIEAGKLTIENHPFSLTDLVHEIQDGLSFLGEKKGIPFIVSMEQTSDLLLLGDRLRLYQILYNLVNNSLKFTEKGKVELSVNAKEQDNDQHLVTFQVKDTGIGIRSEMLKKIFDSFVQAEATITRNFGGTGLGLAISNELVRLMGGNLEVRSVPELGSTFFFSIILHNAPPDSLQQNHSREEYNIPPKHVLLVEDDRGNQELASAILKNAGHTAVVANDGLEALNILSNGELFHAIFMDIQMPVLDGLTTTQCIRRVEEGRLTGLQECDALEDKLASNLFAGHLNIIAMTANSILSNKRRYLEVGVDNFLAKPYTKVQMLKVLQECGDVSNSSKIVPPEATSSRQSTCVSYERCRQYLLDNFNLDDASSKNVLDSFIGSLQKDLRQLHNAIFDKNRDNLRLISHKIKGALYNINLAAQAHVAEELEKDADIQGLATLETLAAKLEKSLSPLMKRDTEQTSKVSNSEVIP